MDSFIESNEEIDDKFSIFTTFLVGQAVNRLAGGHQWTADLGRFGQKLGELSYSALALGVGRSRLLKA